MPTIAYQNEKGERLQGCTTIKSQQIGWGKQPLLIWSNKEGLAGRTLNQARDTATIPGTIAHLLVECHLRGTKPDLLIYENEDIKKAETAFQNFQIWTEQFKLKSHEIEPHLVSEKYQFGGTPDLIAYVRDELAIIDWKTGKIYEDTFLQLASYKMLWEENHPDMPITGGFHVLRIPKNEDIPSFHHHFWKVLPAQAWEAMVCALELKGCQEVLKKLL